MYQILKNWPERRVKAICLTDGERVGSLGDLGVQAVGAAISKLSLYTACAGIPPSVCLPICLDAGMRARKSGPPFMPCSACSGSPPTNTGLFL